MWENLFLDVGCPNFILCTPLKRLTTYQCNVQRHFPRGKSPLRSEDYCLIQLQQVYVPTVFENYIGDFEVDGKYHFECALWDTAGQECYDRLRPLSYSDTNVYCICFAIDGPDSLDNVYEKVPLSSNTKSSL
jgi:GTPase SAR1 family protein